MLIEQYFIFRGCILYGKERELTFLKTFSFSVSILFLLFNQQLHIRIEKAVMIFAGLSEAAVALGMTCSWPHSCCTTFMLRAASRDTLAYKLLLWTVFFSLSRAHLMLNTMHRKQESHINSCDHQILATLHPISCLVLCLLQVLFFLGDSESRVRVRERRKAEGRVGLQAGRKGN